MDLMKTDYGGSKPALWPTDLRLVLGERRLVTLALDAIQTLDWNSPNAPRIAPAGHRPQMMLTLLSCCYAAGICGSQDIEWSIENDRMVRYICARTYPDWLAIRGFRRRNREWLRHCLAYIFRRTWLWLCEEVPIEDAYAFQAEAALEEHIAAAVQGRIELAVIMDRAALE
jgi:hypothetical protein